MANWLGNAFTFIQNPTAVLFNGGSNVTLSNTAGTSTTLCTTTAIPSGSYLFTCNFTLAPSAASGWNTDEFFIVQLGGGICYSTGAPYYLSDETGTSAQVLLSMSGVITLSTSQTISVTVVRNGNLSTNKFGLVQSITYTKLSTPL